EEAAAQQKSANQDRHGQAVNADSARLERRDFIVLGQYAEHHQHRRHHADRSEAVDQARREKEQIGEHSPHGDVVLDDVAQQFEEREDVGHQQEADQPQKEVENKTGKKIRIHHLRK